MRLHELTIARAKAPSSQQVARGEAEGGRTRSGHEVARLRRGAARRAALATGEVRESEAREGRKSQEQAY